jgi:hypothetical protein
LKIEDRNAGRLTSSVPNPGDDDDIGHRWQSARCRHETGRDGEIDKRLLYPGPER